jgi:hypothetical protein
MRPDIDVSLASEVTLNSVSARAILASHPKALLRFECLIELDLLVVQPVECRADGIVVILELFGFHCSSRLLRGTASNLPASAGDPHFSGFPGTEYTSIRCLLICEICDTKSEEAQKRKLSAAGKAAIVAALKKRWAAKRAKAAKATAARYGAA